MWRPRRTRWTVIILGAALATGTFGATAFADTPVASVSLTVVDGAGTFNGDDGPGHDSGPGNGVVRTNDAMTYRVAVGVGESATDETNITLSLPAGVELTALPTWCSAAGSPPSAVTPMTLTAPGAQLPVTATTWLSLPAQTVLCNVGSLPPHAVTTYSFEAKVRPEVPNGTVLVANAAVSTGVELQAVADPVSTLVSAQARYDLTVWGMGSNNVAGAPADSALACPFDATRTCRATSVRVLITVPGGPVGTSPLTAPTFTANFDLSPSSLWGQEATDRVATWDSTAFSRYGARLSQCSLNNSVSSVPDGKASLSDTTTAVRDSGTVSCSQSTPGSAVSMSFTGTDLSAWTTPTRTRTPDAAIATTPEYLNRAYVASVTLRFDVPLDAYQTLGTANRLVTVLRSSWDPGTDVSGLANIGESSADATLDNTLQFTSQFSSNTGWQGYLAGAPWNSVITPASTYRPTWTTHQGPAGSTAIYADNGMVVPGEDFLAVTNPQNGLPAGSQSDGRIVCTSWDPNQANLHTSNAVNNATWPSGLRVSPAGAAAWASYLTSTIDYTIQYGRRSTIGSGTSSTCGPETTWYASPQDVPGNDPTLAAQGIYTAVNSVRLYTYLVPRLAGTQYLFFAVNLQARSTALDGSTWAADTKIPIWFASMHRLGDVIGSSAGITLADLDALNTGWEYGSAFSGTAGIPGKFGDRVRLGSGLARLTTQTFDDATSTWGTTAPATAAGHSTQMRLSPTFRSSVANGISRPVRVSACLPAGMVYTSSVPAASSVADGAPGGATLNCTAGHQYVVWNLGAQTVNTALPQITLISQVTSAAPNGTATVTTAVEADYEYSSAAARTAPASFLINSPTAVSLTLIAPQPVVDATWEGAAAARTLEWELLVTNGGSTAGLTTVDVISALPQLTDDTFSGAATFASATASAGVQVLYTGERQVVTDPNDASNGAAGSTPWCDATDGGLLVQGVGVCPASAADVTGVRLLKDGDFTSADTVAATVRLHVSGNTGGDSYLLEAGAAVTGLPSVLGPAAAPIAVTSASVGDLVWLDSDEDGLQGFDEPGLANVAVNLFGTDDLGNTVSADTTTDSTGHYRFTGLPAGDYQLSVQNAGGRFTATRAGADLHTSSLVDVDGQALLTVAVGSLDLDADAGLLPLSVSGLTWADHNGDGIRQTVTGGPTCAGETPLAANLVHLVGTSDFGEEIDRTVATSAAGLYTFTGLLPGNYDVTFTAPDGYLASPPAQSEDPTVDSDGDTRLTLAQDSVTGLDAGWYQPTGVVVLSGNVVGGGASLVPVGTTAEVTLSTCGGDDIRHIRVDGTTTSIALPAGTAVRFTAVSPAPIADTSWAPPVLNHENLTVASGQVQAITVTHDLRVNGSFTVNANLIGTGAEAADDATLTLRWWAQVDGQEQSGAIEVTTGAHAVAGPTLPENTVVHLGPVTAPADDATLIWGDVTMVSTLTIVGGTLTPVVLDQDVSRATSSFQLQVVPSGDASDDLPPGTTVQVHWTYLDDANVPVTGELEALADGSTALVPVDVPTGAELTFVIDTTPSPGLRYATVVVEPVTIGQTPAVVVVDLPVYAVTGTVTVAAQVTGTGLAELTPAATLTVPYTVTSAYADERTGVLELGPDDTVTVPGELREGDTVEFATVTLPETRHVVWGTAAVTPGSVIVTDGATQLALTVQVTRITNAIPVMLQLTGTGLPVLLHDDVTWQIPWSAQVDGHVVSGTVEAPASGEPVWLPALPEDTAVVFTAPRYSRDDVTVSAVELSTGVVVVGEADAVVARGVVTARTATIAVRIQLTGSGAALSGPTLRVPYTWAWAGQTGRGSLLLPADGAVGATAPLPVGTKVTFSGVTPTSVAGASWSAPTRTVAATVTGGRTATPAKVIAAQLNVDLASFTVRAQVLGTGTTFLPDDATLPVVWTATSRGETTTGTLQLPADGSPVAGPLLPVGAVVSFAPVDPAAVTRTVWGEPVVPAEVVIGSSSTPTTVVERSVNATTGSFSVRLRLAGSQALPPGTTIAARYVSSDGSVGVLELPVDGTEVNGPVLPTGAQVKLTLEEPDIPGISWVSLVLSDSTLTITESEVVALVLSANLTDESLAATGASPESALFVVLSAIGLGLWLALSRRYLNRGRSCRVRAADRGRGSQPRRQPQAW